MAPSSYSPPSRRKRSSSSSNKTLCSSLMLLLLILLGLLTISLNILYVQLHHGHKKHRTTTTAAGQQAVRMDRRGHVLHHEIHKVTWEELGLEDDALPPFDVNMTREEALRGKQVLVDLLHSASVHEIDTAVLQKLPTWHTIQQLYGNGPRIHGLETCQAFRETVAPSHAFAGVAGMFNTGTNLMALYLEANCEIPSNHHKTRGMKWQVPWGKHMLAQFKNVNTAGHEAKTDKESILPVVLVRDPYSWMQSMCRNHYGVRWHYTKDHCPNLVPNQEDLKLFPFQTNHIPVRLDFDGNVNITSYDSLAHLWSEWYRQYVYDADYPRIVVRYEDLMYYPQELTRQICNCVGGVPIDKEFTFLVDSAKWGPGHGDQEHRTSLITAMIKYGNVEKRLRGYTQADLQLAHEALSPDLMDIFQYNRPLEHDIRTAKTN